jgi:hypothetical protein
MVMIAKLDRVVLALLAGIGLLAMIDRPQVAGSIQFTIDSLVGMAPFMLLAILLRRMSRHRVLIELSPALFQASRIKRL